MDEGWWRADSPRRSLSPKWPSGERAPHRPESSSSQDQWQSRRSDEIRDRSTGNQHGAKKSCQLRNPLEVACFLETLQLPPPKADGELGEEDARRPLRRPLEPLSANHSNLQNVSSCGLGPSRALAHDASPPDHRKVNKKRQAIGHDPSLMRTPDEGDVRFTPVARARNPA
jgi:hypothetical protein